MRQATVVVPCYNEESRLQTDAFSRFFEQSDIADVIFVDDGSKDGTAGVLQRLCTDWPERTSVMQLGHNCGKAEAVRRGILRALDSDSQFVGFWDADLATPIDCVSLFVSELRRSPQLLAVIGARVRLLGRVIDRRPLRH